MKKCYGCKEHKELDRFHKNKGTKDGHLNLCKDCSKLYKKGVRFGRLIKGKKHVTKKGYVVIYQKNHPNAQKNGSLFEHVIIMSKFLGRPLRKGENVHHKNGIRDDNRLENLELWCKPQPKGTRILDQYEYCQQFVKIYQQDIKVLKNRHNTCHYRQLDLFF